MATGGAVDVFGEKIIRDIGAYYYKAFIHGKYFVNFADGDAIVPVSGAAYGFGKNIGDDRLTRLGASKAGSSPVLMSWFDAYGSACNILTEKERAERRAVPPYVLEAWMPVSEVMATRENEGSPAGLYLAAKAGHNGESHNHNDVGNFILYANGQPVLIDLGTEEYREKTFSPQRFELWYLQSQYHNCPTVNGHMQCDGKAYKAKDAAYTHTEGYTGMTADIAGAYPVEAGISFWRRSCGLRRGEHPQIEIIDEFLLERPTERNVYHFMSAAEPVMSEDGAITLTAKESERLQLSYEADCLNATIETIAVTESRLNGNWGDTLYRINFTEKEVVSEGKRCFTLRLDTV
jgi:hypothetical protein